MFALQRWTIRLLAVAVVTVAGAATASAQPARSRPVPSGAGFQPQINTSPYANGSIQRALVQQQIGMAYHNNPYAFYPPVVNPWAVQPAIVNPVFAPPVVNPWLVNPAVPAYFNPANNAFIRPVTPFYRPW